MIEDPLKGVGHFSIWFILGYCLFLLLRARFAQSEKIRVYGPFLSYIMGCIAVVPYLLVVLGLIEHEVALSLPFNLFLGYGWLNQIPLVVAIFKQFHLSVTLVGVVYLLMVIHYIKMVKWARRQNAA